MKQILLVGILAAIPFSSAIAQAVNPLVRPPIGQQQPQMPALPPPPAESSQSQKPSFGSSASSGSDSKRSIPKFDGWMVSYATPKKAVLRFSEQVTQKDNAPKAGSPGFGAPGGDSGSSQSSFSASSTAGQMLEVMHGQIFAMQDAAILPNIEDGVVTLYYIGSVSDIPEFFASGKKSRPDRIQMVVFSGAVSSHPAPKTIALEKPDDRYIKSITPKQNNVRSALGSATTSTPGAGSMPGNGTPSTGNGTF